MQNSHSKVQHASVVITTYNWPAALEKALQALALQDTLPAEIIVADDGSADDTRACIARVAADYPVPLRHSWQPDLGFRASLSRNRAIAAATGDYIVLLDGDMVPHPSFISDHLSAARVGTFLQGVRVLTTVQGRDKLLRSDCQTLGFFDTGIERRRHTLRLPWLAALLAWLSSGNSLSAIKTCNQGWWRSDLIALNGFDERYEGWGREDKDLAVRAIRAGIRRRSLRFSALVTHLYHRERHDDGSSPNEALFQSTLGSNVTRCEYGIDRHVLEFEREPLPDLRQL